MKRNTLRFLKRPLVGLMILFMMSIPKMSCKDMESWIVDCAECYTEPFVVAPVYIWLSSNSENQEIPITVYYGPYEDNRVAVKDTAHRDRIEIVLETNSHYSIKAEYHKNGRPYNVIRGTHLKLRHDTDQCDEPCYYLTGDEVDMRLKF